MKPVVKTPHVVLVSPAKKIDVVNSAVKTLIKDMKETLVAADNPKGVGLAATQIGVSQQVCIIRPVEDGPMEVFINPEIVKHSEELLNGIPGKGGKLEGCLSIPHVWGLVKRFKSITVKYMSESGKSHEKIFTDFPAIILQHEIDHLNGILFPRRVLEQKGQLYKPGVDDNGKEILEPLEL